MYGTINKKFIHICSIYINIDHIQWFAVDNPKDTIQIKTTDDKTILEITRSGVGNAVFDRTKKALSYLINFGTIDSIDV